MEGLGRRKISSRSLALLPTVFCMSVTHDNDESQSCTGYCRKRYDSQLSVALWSDGPATPQVDTIETRRHGREDGAQSDREDPRRENGHATKMTCLRFRPPFELGELIDQQQTRHKDRGDGNDPGRGAELRTEVHLQRPDD